MRRLSLLLVLVSCTANDSQARWVGTIDTLPNGTVRVSNAGRGIWQEGEGLQLVRDLELGAMEGDGPDVFTSISDIEVGKDGRIYVLDRQSNDLRIFDRAGKHLRTVGRSGSGPGEYTAAFGLEWLPGTDSLLVADGRGARYTILDADGNFVRSMVRPIRSYGWVFEGGFADGRLYERGSRRVAGESSSRTVLVGMRLGAQAELSDTVAFPQPDPAARIEGYAVRHSRGAMVMSVPHAPASVWYLRPDGSFWWGFANEYLLYHISARGDTLRSLRSEATPVPVTDEEIAEWAAGEGPTEFKAMGGDLDLGRIPKHKPYFTDLYIDPSGRLWVHVPTTDGLTAFDLFDEHGRSGPSGIGAESREVGQAACAGRPIVPGCPGLARRCTHPRVANRGLAAAA